MLSLISETQHMKYLIKIIGKPMQTIFEHMTFGSDIMLNHHLS